MEHNDRYYILSECKKKAHWVQNIINNPKVSFSVSDGTFEGGVIIIEDADNDNDDNSKLVSEVCRLMHDKYGWSDGLIVELRPE